MERERIDGGDLRRGMLVQWRPLGSGPPEDEDGIYKVTEIKFGSDDCLEVTLRDVDTGVFQRCHINNAFWQCIKSKPEVDWEAEYNELRDAVRAMYAAEQWASRPLQYMECVQKLRKLVEED